MIRMEEKSGLRRAEPADIEKERGILNLAERYCYPEDYEEKSRLALETALRAVPAYRGWSARDPGPGAPVDERYAAMPKLTKRMMREAFPDGLVPEGRDAAAALASGEIEYTFTSGTTEEKVVNLWDQGWWNRSEEASWKLNAHTAALPYPARKAELAGAQNIGIACEEDLPTGHRVVGRTLYLNEKTNLLQWQTRHLERMARELEEFRPEVLEANPSLLARLAFWSLDGGRELYRPPVIIFTYEFASKIHLAAIRKAFPSSAFVSSFGSTETGFVLEQCESGLLHQNTAYCRVDFQPLKERYGGPELGRILVTTFGNPWNSIVRFDTGDLVRLHRGACRCGRALGLIADAVEGRTGNATFTADGGLVTTKALDDRLSLIPGLRDYSLAQSAPGVCELLVKAENPKEAAERARGELASLYGRNGEFTVRAVPDLLPGPSFKYRRTYADFKFNQEELFA